MGTVFGKESVKEPHFDVVLQRSNDKTSYELRKYGERYTASVEYNKADDTGSPFRILARYIGVFGTPENEGSTSIAMTAPVVMEDENKNNNINKPTAISMTAPVVMENTNSGEDNNNMKKMMFMLPEEYNDMSKIPKPTNSRVHIEHIPSELGVVHRYNGSFNDKINSAKAKELGQQLIADGVPHITEEYVQEHYQFWGYNPPFTIPYFKRNEVWLKLDDDQVTYLKEKFPTKTEGGLVGGSSNSKMKGRTMFALGTCGLVLGAVAVNFMFRSKTQYRRL